MCVCVLINKPSFEPFLCHNEIVCLESGGKDNDKFQTKKRTNVSSSEIYHCPSPHSQDNFIVTQKRFKRTLVNTDHEQIEFDDSLEQAIMLQI